MVKKVNKSLLSWVKFVKRVQKEENLNYKDAIHRAKVRKDKGEKWMTGGSSDSPSLNEPSEMVGDVGDGAMNGGVEAINGDGAMNGGRKKTKTKRRKSRGRKSRKNKSRRRR